MRNKRYDFIRFIATTMIILFHFAVTLRNEGLIETCLLLKGGATNLGAVGVALFFILSGALLHENYKDKFNIKEFYKKRIIRIYLPLWISFIAMYFLMIVIDKNLINYNKFDLLFSMLGFDLFNAGWAYFFNIHPLWVVGEWFTTVIIITYVIFPLLRYLFNNHRIKSTIIIFIICILNIKYKILSFEHGYYSVTNGILYFWIGMLFNKNKDKITNQSTIMISIFLVLLSQILKSANLYDFGYIICVIFSIGLFTLLYQINYSNFFINYISKYNYEIYLIHHRIFIIFIPFLITNNSNLFQIIITFIFLTFIICLLSEKTNEICKLITTKFSKKKKVKA